MAKYPFGRQVQLRLWRLGRTQRQLAEALGYSPSYVSRMLTGRVVRERTIKQIREVLKAWEDAV